MNGVPGRFKKGKAMYDLKDHEVELITGIFYPVDKVHLKQVRLHKVETYGIWVESQDVMEKLLASQNLTSAPQSLALFVPWSQIFMIIAATPTPVLSDRVLQ